MEEVQEEAAAPPQADAAAEPPVEQPAVPGPPRGRAFFYGAGIALQIVFWSLIFLGLAIVVATGGHLTEFRYVGF